MSSPELPLAVLGLALVVVLGVAVARRTGLPDPVVLVGVGLAASFVPGVPVVQLPPDAVFLVFLPPLVYRASFLTSPATLRANATPLALLSIGLVLATAAAVALVVHVLVPGVSVAEGLVLGAIVAPTDPVAASVVFSRLGAPRRIVDIVEGESLINDATALVLYALAVEAVVGGAPTVLGALGALALGVVGGVGVGLVVAVVVATLRKRVQDVGLQLLLSLVTPFLAYLPADRIGASGVLATVTTGVVLGSRVEGIFGASARLQSGAFWSLLDLVLNATLFVLLGLQLRQVVAQAPDLDAVALLGYAALVVLVVVGLRIAWQLLVPPVVYALKDRLGRTQSRSTGLERLLLGWTGMRGAISLAAALALPLSVHGRPFPQRPLLLFLTAAVVVSTLVLQGLSLPVLLSRTSLGADTDQRQELEVRLALADVALARLEEAEAEGEVPPGATGPLVELWRQTRARLLADSDDAVAAPEVDLVELRLEIARAQSAELEQRRAAGQLHPQVVRELRHELDLQQVRLDRRQV